eukprot:s4107_g3.t1
MPFYEPILLIRRFPGWGVMARFGRMSSEATIASILVREAAARSAAGVLRAAAPELFVDPGTCRPQEEGSSGAARSPAE